MAPKQSRKAHLRGLSAAKKARTAAAPPASADAPPASAADNDPDFQQVSDGSADGSEGVEGIPIAAAGAAAKRQQNAYVQRRRYAAISRQYMIEYRKGANSTLP